MIDSPARLRYTRRDINLRERAYLLDRRSPFHAPLARLLPPWWLFLITGIGWTIVALILLRSDYTTVRAISNLFGIGAIAAGILEVGVPMLAQGWWKLLYAVLAVAFIAAGIVSFIHPGDTFVALAAVISFFLVFAGTFDIGHRSRFPNP